MTENRKSLNPTPEEIVTALSKTGFILEHRVAQELRQAGFDADVNVAYPDPDTRKTREMDVYGFTSCNVGERPCHINLCVDVVIECKSSQNPFVLIGECGQDEVYTDPSVILSFDPLLLRFAKAHGRTVKYGLNLISLPGSRGKDDFMGHQLVRMNQKGNAWLADNNSVYDGILYPLAKAWQHRINLCLDDIKGMTSTWKYPFLMYVFPVIVTAGPVFTVDVTREEIEVKEVGWAGLKREFSAEEMAARDLRADVVSFAYLPDYLNSRILEIYTQAQATLRKNGHLFNPEWLISNLGDPKDRDSFTAWQNHVRTQKVVSKSDT